MLNARLTGLSDQSGKKGMPVLVVSAGSAGILNALGITGVNVFGLYPAGTGADLEVRSFAPADGIPEDPVCGSGNGCVGADTPRRHTDDAPLCCASGALSRPRRRFSVRFDDGAIWLGGHAVTCVEGSLHV